MVGPIKEGEIDNLIAWCDNFTIDEFSKRKLMGLQAQHVVQLLNKGRIVLVQNGLDALVAVWVVIGWALLGVKVFKVKVTDLNNFALGRRGLSWDSLWEWTLVILCLKGKLSQIPTRKFVLPVLQIDINGCSGQCKEEIGWLGGLCGVVLRG